MLVELDARGRNNMALDEMECILRLTGVGSVEELDAEEVERLLHLLDRPVNLNTVSAGRLAATGLLTAYQIASLTDYRMNHGNVMSYMELSAVDGFNADMVSALKPFIILTVNDFAAPRTDGPPRQELAVRASGKAMMDYAYGMKYRIEAGERFIGGLGVTRSYDSKTGFPSAYTGNLQWEFKKIYGKVILGDFNARFGQGLALWSGMLMDNLTSPSAMMRKPTGLTRSSSFTGSSALTGAAMELGFGDFVLSLAASYPFLGIANFSWTGFNGKVSLTHVTDKRTSADAAFCFNGVNAYAEAVYDWNSHRPSVVAGTDFPSGENLRTGVQVQCLARELYCLAVSTAGNGRERRATGTLSANVTYYPVPKKGDEDNSMQVKARFDGAHSFSEKFSLKVRLTERYRTWGHGFKTEVRADLSYVFGLFSLMSRVNVQKCDGYSGLVYVEGAWKFENLSLYARQGLFIVDDWDDRIYVYERDAPGSFNVPAMYGRGLWGNVVMTWKVSRMMKIYLRAAYTSYALMEKQKPGKAELKLHFVFRF